MTEQGAPPNWWPDPLGRFELRYWDGSSWTHHVSTRGQPAIDSPVAVPTVPTSPAASAVLPVVTPEPTPAPAAPRAPQSRPNKKIQRQVARAGAVADGRAGGGTLFTEPVLVVNQKAKMIEVNAEYAVYDQHGHRIGAVREVGQSMLRGAVSVRPSSSRAKRLQIIDAEGRVVLALQRPEKFAKSTVIVRNPDGTEAGRIVQKTLGVIGKVRFDLVVGGQALGCILAESWGIWDFSIQDASGTEIARITKGRALGGGQTSTKRDKYVVEIAAAAQGPLRTLAVASALAVDTAMRQHK